ncbi:hypothetical protein QQP08_021829 [Theobroma cacao]|nr:hypothetical protein QQP08_021829 [Theobroma cacao]
MAFLLQENSLCISRDNDFNSALLMSFLEESSPSEDYNHEELDSLMRSLAAEINPNSMDIQDLMTEPESPSDGNKSHGPESIVLDFEWADMEPTPSPSPSHDMNWHMDVQGEEVDALIEIADDYSDVYFGDVLEGQIYITSLAELDAIEM